MARKNLETERKKRNLWMLENVDELTKKIIKMHAIEHDTTIATALKQLVEAGKSALTQTK
jgi:IS1 family transposase